jgi:hypothetical protein
MVLRMRNATSDLWMRRLVTAKLTGLVSKVTAVVIVLIAGWVPGPAQAEVHTQARAMAMPAFEHIENATSTQVYLRDGELRVRYYKLFSLSVSYDDVAKEPRYAAIWIQAIGPDQAVFMDMSYSEYWDRTAEYVLSGEWQPTMITVTGGGNTAVYAVVFAKISKRDYMAYEDLTFNEFYAKGDEARVRGLMPTSVDFHGTVGEGRRAAVYTPNTPSADWDTSEAFDLKSDMIYDDRWRKKGYYPVDVALDNTVCCRHIDPPVPSCCGSLTVWRADKNVQWYKETRMSEYEYQTRIEQKRAEGFYPYSVDSEDGMYIAAWRK